MNEIIYPGQALCISDGLIETVPKNKWYWRYVTDSRDVLIFGISDRSIPTLNRWVLEIKNTRQNIPFEQYIVDENKIETRDVTVNLVKGYPYQLSFDLVVKHSEKASNWEIKHITLGQKNRISGNALEKRGKIRYLLADSGYYPTRLVVMLGDTHNGKSCFLYALHTHAVARRLSRMLPDGGFYGMQETLRDVIPPTQPQDVHYYPFYASSEGKIASVIYFLDLAGEISRVDDAEYEDRNANGGHAPFTQNLQYSIASYASALLVVSNLHVLAGAEGGPVTFLKMLSMKGQLPKQICYVQTEADLLEEMLQRDPAQRIEMGIGQNSKVFQNVAEQPDEREALFQHMAIANEVMRNRLLNLKITVNSPCFMVSSCCKKDSQLDFSNAKNVELPVAYLVRQFVKF